MPTKDPRTYIKAVPLPIPSQKGLKLQARAASVYNPTSPTRQEVWKSNFDRRKEQLTEQGFYSVPHKPYKGVGDPFFLEEKRLILHSLGQWNDNDDWDSSSSSDEEDDGAGALAMAPQSTMTAAKFVLRRARKDLNTLGKEVVKGRGMIRNVKLGHGLFDLIRQDRVAKKAAAFAEKKKHLEESRNQWQPPHNSSSEEESDDDLDKDEDLENYFGPNIQDGCSEDFDMTSSLAYGSRRFSLDAQSRFSKQSSATSRKKKKVIEPRPFTPQHTNLSEVNEYNENFSESSLFRQLCALNWILDAMNIEQGYTMGPITTCWSHLEVGGSKITPKRAREERKAETDWERWLNNQQMGRVSKKGSITRLSRQIRQPRFLMHPRVSVQSTSLSPSSSSSQVNTTGPSLPLTQKDSIIEEQMNSSYQEPDEEETLHRTGIFKFLDEYYDSLRREAQLEEEKQRAAAGEGGGGEESQNQMLIEQNEAQGKRESHSHRKSKKSDRQKTPDGLSSNNPRFDSPEERNRSRFFLKDLRMDSSYKPKNTAELMEFHASKSSNRYCNLRQDLHNKFKEVQDDKAMTLHDILEQMDRERFSKCQNKLSKLRTQSMSFHRAIEEMRREGEKMISRPDDVRRQSSFKGNWYTDLLQSLPVHVKDIWYYRTVLQKLAKYGLPRASRISISNALKQVENTSKQSVYKFLKVLESLRHWEICSPDISAAIEFCREKIVDMTVDEYEEWFSQAFPKVSRPRTAPPASKSQGESQKLTQAQKALEATPPPSKTAQSKEFVSSNYRQGAHSSFGNFSGSRSAVPIANGINGKHRFVQSAVARKQQ